MLGYDSLVERKEMSMVSVTYIFRINQRKDLIESCLDILHACIKATTLELIENIDGSSTIPLDVSDEQEPTPLVGTKKIVIPLPAWATPPGPVGGTGPAVRVPNNPRCGWAATGGAVGAMGFRKTKSVLI